jgi:hypothetical protein
MSNIAYLAAKAVEGRDWHRLHPDERVLVTALEKSGHLKPSSNGFVGDAVEPAVNSTVANL